MSNTTTVAKFRDILSKMEKFKRDLTTCSTPKPFIEKVENLMFEIAEHYHSKNECGYTASQDFQMALNEACAKTAKAPLQNSSFNLIPKKKLAMS